MHFALRPAIFELFVSKATLGHVHGMFPNNREHHRGTMCPIYALILQSLVCFAPRHFKTSAPNDPQNELEEEKVIITLCILY